MMAVAPFLIFFVGAVLAAVTAGPARAVVVLGTPVIGAIHLYALPPDALMTAVVFGRELVLVESDRMTRLFGWLFLLAAFMTGLYSLHTRDRLQHVAILAYAGCAMGAVFAGDLPTLFLFWEGLALTSVFLVLARRNDRATSSALRYLVIQVLSGMLLLAGILALHGAGQSLDIRPLELEGTASWLLFLALGIKAGFPLLHGWITDSYPEATEAGTVALGAFTTKVAILMLARMFPGTELLVWIGAAMAVFPIFYALIENDLRRVLCYSLIVQLGFMVVGIGIGTELALDGAVAHAFTHVVYKSLLFMAMGAVLFRTGRIAATDLGGLARTMPITTGLCIVGALAISALPLLSGFVSKSMVLSAALYAGYDAAWLALLFASAGALLYVGIKVPFFAFFGTDSGLRPNEAPLPMLAAMAIAAAGCILIGIWPAWLLDMLPYATGYDAYTTGHVLSQMQLLLFAALAFVVLRRLGLYPPAVTGTNLDADWLYRRLLPCIALAARDLLAKAGMVASAVLSEAVLASVAAVQRWHGPRGVLARDPIGGLAMLAIVALLVVVLALEMALGRF